MLRTKRRVLLFVLIACAIVLAPRELRLICAAGSSVQATPVEAGAKHPVAAAAALPADLEVVIIIEDLAALRQTAEAGAVTALLSEAGLVEPLAESWAMLAERLGLTADEAIDRLLGRRVLLALRPGEAPATSRRWTLLSDVDDATADLLRSRLDVAPRTVVKGQQVYAVEGGNLDLALHRRADNRVTLLLGPSDAPHLLNELILAVVRPLPEEQTMARSPVLDESRRLGAADVVVLARVDPPPEQARPGAPHWDNFLVLNLRREAAEPPQKMGGLSARIILRDASAWEQLAGITPFSDAPVAAAGEALVAVLEATSPRAQVPDAAGPVRAILSNLAPPPALSERTTGRRAMFVLPRVDTGGEEPRPGVRIAFAAELEGVESAAPLADRLIADRIGDAERLLGSDTPPPSVSVGIPLRSVRTEALRLSRGNVVEQITGGRPVVAWTFQPTPGGEEEEAGWCVLSLSAADQDPAATARQVAQALVAPPGDDAQARRRWMSVGHIEPASLAESLGQLPALQRLVDGLGRVRRIEWRLELTNLLDVEGEATIRLAEPKPLW